jgi:hypothetical protein
MIIIGKNQIFLLVCSGEEPSDGLIEISKFLVNLFAMALVEVQNKEIS